MKFKEYMKKLLTPKTKEEIEEEIEKQELILKLEEVKQKRRKAKQ